MKYKKEKIIGIILVIILLVIFVKPMFTGESIQGQPLRHVSLSAEEKQKVISTVLSTEFIKDIPNEDPVALVIYDFEGNERIVRDAFLIGENNFLSEGNPSVNIWIHVKYISKFDGSNLCEIIQLANKNGDLALNSPHSNTKLLFKYSKMLKYRDCFGF